MKIKLEILDTENGIYLNFPNGAEFLTQHGFGLFLKDWEEGEVVITEKAKKGILQNTRQIDLGGITFFSHKTIGIAGNSVAYADLDVIDGAKEWIEKLPIKQD